MTTVLCSAVFSTSVFMLILGVERVFHLDEMDDPGFALLTGNRRRCPSRQVVGAWRKHLVWNEVDRFCHRTSPWDLLHDQESLLSFDEHSIPRWTKKFSIPKGYVTTRNKYMRCEKLYYGYDLRHRRFVTVKATPGKVELRDVSGLLTRRMLRFGQPASLHALFDAGAGKSDADVRALLTLAETTPNLDVTLRACRYPHRVKTLEATARLTRSPPMRNRATARGPRRKRYASRRRRRCSRAKAKRRPCEPLSVAKSSEARRRTVGIRCIRASTRSSLFRVTCWRNSANANTMSKDIEWKCMTRS